MLRQPSASYNSKAAFGRSHDYGVGVGREGQAYVAAEIKSRREGRLIEGFLESPCLYQ